MSISKTPGVYVKEISKFPPSVAGVATAIPVFIGFTEKCADANKNVPTPISSLLDYEEKFGKSCKLVIDSGELKNKEFVMYNSMRLYFDNGGGNCYVVSVGQYGENGENVINLERKAGTYTSCMEALEKVDEITLLVYPDAAMILNATNLATVHQAALKHCYEMGDRFAILDIAGNGNEAIKEFRREIGMNHLNFGAAYYPNLKTTYSSEIDLQEMMKIETIANAIKDSGITESSSDFSACFDYSKVIPNLKKEYEEQKAALEAKKTMFEALNGLSDAAKIIEFIVEKGITTDLQNEFHEKSSEANPYQKDIESITGKIADVGDFTIDGQGNIQWNGVGDKDMVIYNDIKAAKNSFAKIMEDKQQELTVYVNTIKANVPAYSAKLAELQEEAAVITPSAAIAGLYCANDNNVGVWQAPANVSIASVSAVTTLLSDNDQDTLNVDASAGKSINAIRYFAGKGIMVWGARTLDGNSNEWRYIPVRRLFNYVEESVKKSTSWAVFQPNDANTWTKIQCQIESFLNNLWRDGALAGDKPEKAFYVRVGLGVTMTADDINNGLLYVEIGMAAVRPAEFIVLKFSHKMQE
ncbi:MAG: phage tail sheath family protein [Bacteroidaceae bacterium]|nr:phage tail sheath family protein [Bacteroidaceae bacterium]